MNKRAVRVNNKQIFGGNVNPYWKRQRRGHFIALPDGFLCADCIPPEVDMSDPKVEVWKEYSSGWTGSCICKECKLSIPIYVDADAAAS